MSSGHYRQATIEKHLLDVKNLQDAESVDKAIKEVYI